MIHNTLHLVGQGRQFLQRLPAKYEIRGEKFVAVVLLAFAFLFGTESIFVAISALLNGDFANTFMGTQHMVFAPVAILFLVWGINQFFIRGELLVDNLRVRCTYRNLRGKHTWREEIKAYRGIQKKLDHGASRETTIQRYYCIWLRHGKRSRSIRLYKASTNARWDEQAEFYSKLFDLPLIEK